MSIQTSFFAFLSASLISSCHPLPSSKTLTSGWFGRNFASIGRGQHLFQLGDFFLVLAEHRIFGVFVHLQCDVRVGV